MKGAFFVTYRLTLSSPRLRVLGHLMHESHEVFESVAARDKRAEDLREQGYDVRTSDGV